MARIGNAESGPRRDREHRPKPPRYWTDEVARWLRTNRAIARLYRFLTRKVIPLLLVFVAVPFGALVGLVYLPKFYRNHRRRRRYQVRLEKKPIERIQSAPVTPRRDQ